MQYSIRVNKVKKEDGNVRGFATVVFGDLFKITNIAIVENRGKGQPERGRDGEVEMPQFFVTVVPFEREGSNIRGLARVYFEDSFIVNNVNIFQDKEKVFVSMPSYKTKQKEDANSQDKTDDKEESKNGQVIGSGEVLPFR